MARNPQVLFEVEEIHSLLLTVYGHLLNEATHIYPENLFTGVVEPIFFHSSDPNWFDDFPAPSFN